MVPRTKERSGQSALWWRERWMVGGMTAGNEGSRTANAFTRGGWTGGGKGIAGESTPPLAQSKGRRVEKETQKDAPGAWTRATRKGTSVALTSTEMRHSVRRPAAVEEGGQAGRRRRRRGGKRERREGWRLWPRGGRGSASSAGGGMARGRWTGEEGERWAVGGGGKGDEGGEGGGGGVGGGGGGGEEGEVTEVSRGWRR